MKNVKNVSVLVLLTVLMFSSSIANAQMGNGSKNTKGTQEAFQGMENRIPDLTDKQKTEIKTLRITHMKEVQQLQNQIDIKRAELKALQTQDKVDMDAVNGKISEKAALRTELEKKKASFRQNVRNLLTDEQKIMFDKKMSHHMKGEKAGNCGHKKQGKKCGDGHGKGHGHGNGAMNR